MREYELMNKKTGEREYIYGYSVTDAFARRKGLNAEDWQVIGTWYID